MKKFFIAYNFDKNAIQTLKEGADFPYSTFSELMIFMNGKLVTYNGRYTFTEKEYLWNFFLQLLEITLDLSKSENDKINNLVFMDNPTTLKFYKYNGRVEISLISSVGRNKKEEIDKATVELVDFSKEVSEISKTFIRELIQINPKLEYVNDIKKFNELLMELSTIVTKAA